MVLYKSIFLEGTSAGSLGSGASKSLQNRLDDLLTHRGVGRGNFTYPRDSGAGHY